MSIEVLTYLLTSLTFNLLAEDVDDSHLLTYYSITYLLYLVRGYVRKSGDKSK